ncbi:aldose epimerase family protein [Pediococcus pentosaceus]|uniref:aldose epimerase family protein n=1 Tax=Pediococcus pentosaceus TaxID=1255 RepID=UPI002017A7D8|nr:aldose epimerase family protein [Pediococcus pentosaceus]MCL3859221.1 galactose mutarotase [Pediococcus pentosaceus]
MKINKEEFQNVNWYTLSNDNHVSVTISTLGATVVAVNTPDKKGNVENIVLGFDNPQTYPKHNDYFGASVARVAGRIKDGKWRDYQLNQNEGQNTLHGGNKPSLSYVNWKKISKFIRPEEVGLVLKRFSIDGENGFPGDLTIDAIFRLNNRNEFSITYIGHASKQTLFNPTNHMYFNLSGDAKRSIKQHQIELKSDVIAEVDAELIPTGNLLNVDGTPYDLHHPTSMQSILDQVSEGLDTAFKVEPSIEAPQLTLEDPESGRKIRVQTSANAFTLFTTNEPQEPFKINGNQDMAANIGLAIEPQMLPDAIHHSGFGNIIISPSKPMMYRNVYYLN